MLWLIFSPVILLLLYALLVCPKLPRRDITPLSGVDYAHRGLWDATYPENSLPAFEQACLAGYGIELDVQLTADGQLVVFHDDDMYRMTGDHRDIRTCTLTELSSLRLKGTDNPIPTFQQVLRTVNGRVPLIVELKTCRRMGELCRKVHEMLTDYQGVYCIESFDPRAIHWWRWHSPTTIRGVLSYGASALPKSERRIQHYLLGSLLAHAFTRPDFVAYHHESDQNAAMGLMRLLHPTLVCWTVRSQARMNELRGRYDLQIFEGFRPEKDQ